MAKEKFRIEILYIMDEIRGEAEELLEDGDMEWLASV